jgi:hypothetical protein
VDEDNVGTLKEQILSAASAAGYVEVCCCRTHQWAHIALHDLQPKHRPLRIRRYYPNDNHRWEYHEQWETLDKPEVEFKAARPPTTLRKADPKQRRVNRQATRVPGPSGC